MSFEAERKAIETTFATAWAGNPVPVIYENTSQKIPKDIDFIYLRIVGGDGIQAEVVGTGPTLMRYTGLIQADIMVKAETGTAGGRVIADQIATIFRRLQLTDEAGGQITFKIPSIRQFGSTVEGRHRIVFSVSYTKDIRQ